MYNRYITNQRDYTPVEPPIEPRQPAHGEVPNSPQQQGEHRPPSQVGWSQLLTFLNPGKKEGASRLLGKLPDSETGLRELVQRFGIDRGDILLFLIVLLLCSEEEDYDLLLALGVVLLLDRKKEGKEKTEVSECPDGLR